MAINYNSDLTKEVVEAGKLQVSRDVTPNSFSDKIVYTCETNPKILRRSELLAYLITRTTTASSVSMLSADPNSDYYITNVMFDNTQDANCDNVVTNIAATLNGVTASLFKRKKQTLTATSTFDFITFNPPLKIDRNTPLTFTHAFTAGTSSSDAFVFGYKITNPNA